MRRRHHGLSLIEILITLAIFVIGILAVLRIFPRGLGTLARVSERQEASRLAESRMNELQRDSARLPDFIIAAGRPADTVPFLDPPTNSSPNPDFGYLRDVDSQALRRPYDLDLPFTDATDPGLLHRVMANDRLVVGEHALVGRRVSPDYTAGGTMVTVARPYHTLFGPIAPNPDGDGGDLAVFRRFERVSAIELERTVQTVAGTDEYRDRPVFAVVDTGRDDLGRPLADQLWFELDSSDRVFLVRLQYRDSYGAIRSVQLAPIEVPGSAVPSSISFAPVAMYHPRPPYDALSEVIPHTVQVQQVLDRDPVGTGSLNRFEYRDGNYARGVIYFSPSLAGEDLQLQYVVEDWRNLREQVTLEVDETGAITSLTDNQIQLDAARDLDPSFTPRVVVLSSGQSLPVDAAAWAADESLARQGRIPIDAAALLDPVAGDVDVMVFYRRFGNWLIVPSIGPSSYILETDAAALASTGSAADYPVQNLLVNVQPGPVVGTDSYTELWFMPSEAGRTVAISYDVGATRELVSGELHVVPTVANRFVNDDPAEPRHAIVLKRPNVSTDNNARPVIHSIEGRSLQLRVAFDEDISGRESAPQYTTPTPGVDYVTAEHLVELSSYVRRSE